MKLRLTASGEILAVYSDKLPLEKLGSFEIQRASFVEFNSLKGVWQAHTPKYGMLICQDRSRDICLEKEKQLIEEQL